MIRDSRAAPVTVAALWVAAVLVGVALAVLRATEPPVWDSLSYVQKGFAFWQAVGEGKLFNPFNLHMTVRPPGTILMSYPLGWSDDFRWFYFRSIAIPLCLLTAAVFIAGWPERLTAKGRWALAAMAIALAGMPLLYQFQANDTLPLAANWGLVDGFMAGVAAIAAAAVWRSVHTRSIGWALAAACAGSLCFWIKPAGLAFMALTGLAWILLMAASIDRRWAVLHEDHGLRRFALLSLVSATLIFAVAAGLAFTSDYFSAENVAFGLRSLRVLESEHVSDITPSLLLRLILLSFGYALPVLMVAGFASALAQKQHRMAALAAASCLFIGMWFWLGETDASQIRYFVPFGAMAFVLLVPALALWAERQSTHVAMAAASLAAVPAVVVAVLVLIPSPPDSWQRAMGVNLHTNDYRAENEQAAALLDILRKEGKETAYIYVSGTSAVLRNVQAVWDYTKLTDASAPKVTALIPTDWQRLSTVRMEDILRCDFIATEISDTGGHTEVLARREVPDFPALIRLINAWMATLDEAEGVSVVSEGRVRIMRITDRARFEAAVTVLEQNYWLPDVYRDANLQRWWSPDELAARTGTPASAPDIAFQAKDAVAPARWIRRTEVSQTADGTRAAFWVESGAGDVVPGPWYLFAHMVDARGEILANAQIELLSGVSPLPDKPIRYYEILYADTPKEAVAVAFGMFKINTPDLDYLTAQSGERDWDGLRVILPLPASR